ncbi:MAG: class I SAM-dependent methyltransferase [Actinomycetota bacterium]|nr:class I SAM-dependent methyltransferase [Actinomycetota bacterium]MDP2287456.1 class I SAM-dependent methyltransferase [Actinomycetota bacterium]
MADAASTSPGTLLDLPLTCPDCRTLLDGGGTDHRRCSICDRNWELVGSKWWFGGENVVVTGDATDSLKSRLKVHDKLYGVLIDIFSPVFPHFISERRRLRKQMTPSMLAIDVGSGNTRLMEGVVNVDLMPYPNVDVVTSADGLPFADDSVDLVFSIAVLEHVPDPHAAIAELVRVLKPGGQAYVFVPFIQGFHAAPYDFQRFTRPGLEQALSDLTIQRTESFGPTSGLVWVLGEWLSIPFSLGIAPLQRWLALIFMTLLSPLKFLDVLLRRMPGGENISTGFLVVATKSPATLTAQPEAV